MPFDVFISHSSADKKIAEALCAGLENAGLRCWIAPRNVTGGLDYADQISEAIQECPATLLVFSNHSNESRHVKAEVDAAFGSGKILLPLRIEVVQPTKGMAHYLRNTHWLDALGTPTEKDIAHVAETLKSLIAGKPAPATPAKAATAPVVSKPGMPPVIVFALVGALVVVAGAISMMFLKKAEPPKTHEVGETPTNTESPELEKVAGPFADAWIALGEVDDANRAFALTELDEPRAEALAEGYRKTGHRDAAMAILAGGKAPTKQNEYTMATLEARGGAVKEALATLRQAEETTGPDPELAADTRLVILDYASGGGTLGLDEADFDTLLAETEKLLTNDESWEGTSRKLRVAQIKAVRKDTVGAAELITETEEVLPESINADTLHPVAEIIRLYVLIEDLKGAETLYAKLKFDVDPDIALLPLVEGLIAADRVADAEKLAFSGSNPESQQKVIGAYIEAEDLEAAATAADGEQATGLALPVLIGNAFSEAGDEEKAKVWLDKARAQAVKGSSNEEQAKGLAEIAKIEAIGGYYEAAVKTMEEAKAQIGLE